MVWILCHCDPAVNPIVPGVAQSIINKHMDYAMAGLPVINTQECQEYRDLIDEYECTINCECGSVDDVVDAITYLVSDTKSRVQMGINARKMGIGRSDRDNTYRMVVNVVKPRKIANSGI